MWYAHSGTLPDARWHAERSPEDTGRQPAMRVSLTVWYLPCGDPGKTEFWSTVSDETPPAGADVNGAKLDVHFYSL